MPAGNISTTDFLKQLEEVTNYSTKAEQLLAEYKQQKSKLEKQERPIASITKWIKKLHQALYVTKEKFYAALEKLMDFNISQADWDSVSAQLANIINNPFSKLEERIKIQEGKLINSNSNSNSSASDYCNNLLAYILAIAHDPLWLILRKDKLDLYLNNRLLTKQLRQDILKFMHNLIPHKPNKVDNPHFYELGNLYNNFAIEAENYDYPLAKINNAISTWLQFTVSKNLFSSVFFLDNSLDNSKVEMLKKLVSSEELTVLTQYIKLRGGEKANNLADIAKEYLANNIFSDKYSDNQLFIGQRGEKIAILTHVPISKGFVGSTFVGMNIEREGEYLCVKKIALNTNINIKINAAKNDINVLDELSRLFAVSCLNSIEDNIYIASELARGKDCFFYIEAFRNQESKLLSFVRPLELVLAFLRELRDFHQQNFTHRDIKPENTIYQIKNRKCKLVDFDFAVKNKSFTENGLCGTAGFFAPESYRGEYSQSTDIYAAGVSSLDIIYAPLHFSASDYAAALEVLDINYSQKTINEQLTTELKRIKTNYINELKPFCGVEEEKVVNFLDNCHKMISLEATARPSLESIINLLEEILTAVQIENNAEHNRAFIAGADQRLNFFALLYNLKKELQDLENTATDAKRKQAMEQCLDFQNPDHFEAKLETLQQQLQNLSIVAHFNNDPKLQETTAKHRRILHAFSQKNAANDKSLIKGETKCALVCRKK